MNKTIVVNRDALAKIIDAFDGPDYYIREMVATQSIGGDEHPINRLRDGLKVNIDGAESLRRARLDMIINAARTVDSLEGQGSDEMIALYAKFVKQIIAVDEERSKTE